MLARLLIALLISTLIASVALWGGSLSPSGAAGALVVGTLVFGFGGWVWGVLLGLFFVSSSWLSRFRATDKRHLAEKFDKGYQRDLGQVLANGGLGSVVAVLSLVTPASGWFPFFVGVTAAVTADTWGTELGTLARRPPRLITSGRPVEVGSSGAISALGTVVSLVGAMFVGMVAGLLSSEIGVTTAVVFGSVAGFAGSLLDSLLGATVQRIYYCDACQKETERSIHKCGRESRPSRGWTWLNNDLVNLISSAGGGMVALGIWFLLG